MGKEKMIQEIKDMINSLPPDEQEVLCDLIQDVIDDLKAMRDDSM